MLQGGSSAQSRWKEVCIYRKGSSLSGSLCEEAQREEEAGEVVWPGAESPNVTHLVTHIRECVSYTLSYTLSYTSPSECVCV